MILLSFVICLAHSPVALAQNGNLTQLTTVDQLIPPIANNSRFMPTNWTRLIGGQNFTWCCTKALADSLTIDQNNTLAFTDNPPAIGLDLDTLQRATDAGQFPCGAVYSGEDPNGAPEVTVSYAWLANTCPGWQLSSGDTLNAWLQPLSGFLLPAVVFCLSVPRRRKFHVPRSLFMSEIGGFKSILPALACGLAAGMIVILDTMIWLSVCFALAGPMILGGLYEALLDNRIVEFVLEKRRKGELTLDMRCRLLMLVLIGNLDLSLDESSTVSRLEGAHSQVQEDITGSHKSAEDGESIVTDDKQHDGSSRSSLHLSTSARDTIVGDISLRPIDPGNSHQRVSSEDRHKIGRSRSLLLSDAAERPHPGTFVTRVVSAVSTTLPRRRPTNQLTASPWRDMEHLLYPIRQFDEDEASRQMSPRQSSKRHYTIPCQDYVKCADKTHFESMPPRSLTPSVEEEIRKTKTRLRTMLNCQYSFGSMVGAPVVFFIGGFIFALLQSLQSLGDEDIALALAFGQWYMIIPHIAIISGLLLAGNNPNILEGIVATQRQEQDESIRFLGLTYNLTYPSCYKVAWQWHRGHNKKLWIDKLLKTYLNRSAGEKDAAYRDLKYLRSKTSLSLIDWAVVLFLAALLLGVPFFLAFITAFYTPQVGLSCRSFTFLMYECSQLGQIFLWLWAYAIAPQRFTDEDVSAIRPAWTFFRPNGWLDARGFYDPTNYDHLILLYKCHSEAGHTVRSIMRASWSALQDFRTLWCCLWYSSSILFTLVATMTAIGATLMQLLGVYTADICNLNVENWLDPYGPGVTAMLSTNSKQMIDDAQRYWKPLAIAAICFMSIVSFVGWWYQRRTRDLFTDQVIKIDEGIGFRAAETISDE